MTRHERLIWREIVPQYTCVLSHTGDQKITLSKPILCMYVTMYVLRIF